MITYLYLFMIYILRILVFIFQFRSYLNNGALYENIRNEINNLVSNIIN